MTESGLVFEAVLAFFETVHPSLNGPEPNDACYINGINPVRDFGIEKIL
jgi:hypothetical protein